MLRFEPAANLPIHQDKMFKIMYPKFFHNYGSKNPWKKTRLTYVALQVGWCESQLKSTGFFLSVDSHKVPEIGNSYRICKLQKATALANKIFNVTVRCNAIGRQHWRYTSGLLIRPGCESGSNIFKKVGSEISNLEESIFWNVLKLTFF